MTLAPAPRTGASALLTHGARPVTLLPTRPAWVLMGVLFGAVGVLVISTTLLPAASGGRTSWLVRLTDVLALTSSAVCLALAGRLPRAALGPFVHVGTLLITVCLTASGGHSTAVAYACTYLVATVYARFVMSQRQGDLHFALMVATGAPVLAVQPGVTTGEVLVVWGMGALLTGAVRWLVSALQASEYDTTTRLPNRRGLERLLVSALADATPPALLVLEVDRLREVDHALGRSAGDELLRHLVDTWTRHLPPRAHLTRCSGTGFAVLLPRTPLAEATALAEVLRAAAEPTASCAVGSAAASREESPVGLVERAERAAAWARERGGHRVHEHPGVGEEGRELREALVRGELVVHFQPIIALADRGVVGAEALVRWQHPERGLLGPGHFLPDVARFGLGLELGRTVLLAACRAAATWPTTADGRAPYLSVNTTGEELLTEGYADDVAHALLSSGLPATRLLLELVEDDHDTTSDVVRRNLEHLREIGVRTAVDDFGTGYSSLDRLRRSGSAVLKIDRSFVVDIQDADQEAPLVSAALALAEALGMSAVAEGVEEEAQAQWLLAHGCDLAQGWLFSPAVPAEQLTAMLRSVGSPASAG